MKTKQALTGIVTDARGWLKSWASDFRESEARSSGGTKANPVAWQLAHVACTQDDVIRLFPGEKGIVPDALKKTYGSGSPPPTKRTRYPKLKELWRLLDRTQARLLKLVAKTPEKELGRKFPGEPAFFTSLGQAAYEISLHETYHVGAIAVLRKSLGKPPIG